MTRNSGQKDSFSVPLMLFILSLIIHLAVLPYFSEMPYYDAISDGFIAVSENTLDGRGFTEAVQTDTDLVYQPAIWNPPVYSGLLLASMFIFGKNIFLFKIMQVFFLSLIPPIIYLFSKKRLEKRYAVLIALLTIAYIPNLRMSSTVLSEVIFGPLLLISAMLFLEKRYFLSGIVFGVSALTRDFGIIFLPTFIAYLFLSKQDKYARAATIFLIAAFIIIFPWMARNYYYYDHFVISVPKIGYSLLEGVAEFDKEGKFNAPRTDPEVLASENATSPLYPDPFIRDKERVRKAIAAIRQEPIEYALFMPTRIPQFLLMNLGSGLAKIDINKAQIYSFEDAPKVASMLLSQKTGILLMIMWIEQGVTYLFAIIGTYYVVSQKRKEDYLFVLIPLIMLINITHHVEPRYFVPVNYFIIFIAVLGLRETRILDKHLYPPPKMQKTMHAS